MMLPPTDTEFTPQQPIELSFICYLDNLSDQEVVYRIRTYYRTDWSEHQQGEWVHMRTNPVVVPGDELKNMSIKLLLRQACPHSRSRLLFQEATSRFSRAKIV